MTALSRSATTPDGVEVHSHQATPIDPWRVWRSDAPEQVASSRNLMVAVRRLLGLPNGRPEPWLTRLLGDLQGFETAFGRRYRCPCCDFLTLPDPPTDTYDICPVCWWEDCGTQYANLDMSGGPNHITLLDARATFAAGHGTCKLRVPELAGRMPMPAEYPPERRAQIPAIRVSGGYPGPQARRELVEPTGKVRVAPIDRTATLPDGRTLHAVRPTPVHSWRVEFAGEPGSAYHGNWLLAVVRALLGTPADAWPAWLDAVVDELCGFDTALGRRFHCPCCDNLTLPGAPTGTFNTCHVCRWEDDPAQVLRPHEPGRWRHWQPSLMQARANYRRYGAYAADHAVDGRPPHPAELPPVTAAEPEPS